MKCYYPKNRSERALWLRNFAELLPQVNATLGLPQAEVDAIVNDARFLAYCYGAWLSSFRTAALAATAAVRRVALGQSPPNGAPVTLPVMTPPPLPDGVVPVRPGAERRILKFVQTIKARERYEDSIGLQLGIVGSEASAEHPVPTFRLKLERGPDGQMVRLTFQKRGRQGVMIHGRRGDGEWEVLGIDLKSPFFDRRPLLVPGQPEVREYRLQFYEDQTPTGPYTPVGSVTVSA